MSNNKMPSAPVTVGIPTYARGAKVIAVIRRVLACQPPPAELIVHVDQSDGSLERLLRAQFPTVRLLSSAARVGPGYGRHLCLVAASQPLFASFDDDSWPVDPDYFARVEDRFKDYPQVACLAAVIFHRGGQPPERADKVEPVVEYTGCGYTIRVAVYCSLPGHIARPIAYGIEERDLCLQMHAAGWGVLECRDLRVFHDTDLSHHYRPEISAGAIENAVILPWLRYPVSLWPYGLLQYGNVILSLLRNRRFGGMATGLLRSPLEVWNHRHLRCPLPAEKIQSYLRLRRPTRGS